MTTPALLTEGEAAERLHEARLWQDGLVVATVQGRDQASVFAAITHYATVYSCDGPVRAEVRTGRGKWRRFVIVAQSGG